ncbi:P-loop containing nucleoside triphosphate hydrolase protein [Ochromonadaceae sp. CCMP2298]|nr:P-loop containing nucleoside triphosphate hydrolase protein [Ochromonadaceae sp. CCMP2298]
MADKDKRGDECIQVVVRCRPLNNSEKEMDCKSIVDIDVEARQVAIRNPSNAADTKFFTFDASYDHDTQQRIFYDESCFSVIEGTLEGFNSTIFAYGQTGCGKSFTMQGPSTTVPELMGVIPNSFSHIFSFVKASKDIQFLIRCSYLELYNEEIKDLLSVQKNPPKCELKEDPNKGVYVKGLTDVVCESAEDLNKMLDKGLASRTTASTLMNAESSRSHSIFTIIVEMNTTDTLTGRY